MGDSTDVAVIGAGIFGVTAALELRSRGREVTLLDPGPLPHPDASSTDISKVIRADYGADDLYATHMEAALPRWRAWNERWSAPLFHETGVTFLSEGSMAEGSFELESYRRLSARGFALERLDATAIRSRFAAWNAEVFNDGYFNPQGGWAQSGRVVAALLAEAKAAGVRVERAAAVALTEGSVQTTRGAIEAGIVVVAAGAWSVTLLPELAAGVRVVGQPVLHFAPPDVAPFEAPRLTPFGADIARTGFYGFCANPDGIVKVAHHGPGDEVDPKATRALPPGTEARFREFLSRALPGLASAPKVGERVCLYCDSRDGDLWIDRVPGRPGVVVATGGSGHAFKLAPLLGDWIADVVDGDAPAPRFAWRDVDAPRFEHARKVR